MKGLGAIISTTVALSAGVMGASVERRSLPAVTVKGNGQLLPIHPQDLPLLNFQTADEHISFSFLRW